MNGSCKPCIGSKDALCCKQVFFMTQLFIRNMQFSTSTFGLLQCHDIYTAIEIGLDCRSLDERNLI